MPCQLRLVTAVCFFGVAHSTRASRRSHLVECGGTCARCGYHEGPTHDVDAHTLEAMRAFVHRSNFWGAFAPRAGQAMEALTRRLEAQATWSAEAVPAASASLPVFYPFSGMDLITAAGVLPNASAFTLAARYPVGRPSCFTIRPCAAAAARAATSWFRHAAGRHFRTSNTKEMAAIFDNSSTGVLPAMLLSIHLLGHELVSAATIRKTHNVETVVLHTVPLRGAQRAGARACGRFVYASVNIDQQTLPRVLVLAGVPPPFSLVLKAAPHHVISTPWFAAAALGAAEVVMADETGPRPSALSALGLVPSPWGGHAGRYVGFIGSSGRDEAGAALLAGNFRCPLPSPRGCSSYPEAAAELEALYRGARRGVGAPSLPFGIGYFRRWKGLASSTAAHEAHPGYWIVSTRPPPTAAAAAAALAVAARSPHAALAVVRAQKAAQTTAQKAAVPSSPPLRLWVILALRRSGSSWLEAMLTKHPRVLGMVDHEPLIRWGDWSDSDWGKRPTTDKERILKGYLKRKRAHPGTEDPPPSTNATLDDYLAELATMEFRARQESGTRALASSSAPPPWTHLVYKLMWHQVPEKLRPGILAWLRRAGAGVIHLVRRASILSLASSLQTAAEISAGVQKDEHEKSSEEAARIAASSSPVEIAPPTRGRKFVTSSELSHTQMTCWGAMLGPARYLRVFYEDLVRDAKAAPILAAAPILRFMGLEPTPNGRRAGALPSSQEARAMAARTYYRVHPGSCADRISNIGDVLAMIEGTDAHDQCSGLCDSGLAGAARSG